MTDAEREKLIDSWRIVLELDPRGDYKHNAVERMRELISERSPQVVYRMEVEQGLR